MMPRIKEGQHRWSGWPGAFCFYCGASDENEIALSIHELDEVVEDRNVRCPAPQEVRDRVDKAMNPEWFADEKT